MTLLIIGIIRGKIINGVSIIIQDLIIGLMAGLISGTITGLSTSQYFRHKDQINLFIKYAEDTTDYACEIYEAAQEYLENNEQSELKKLMRKNLHRPFEIEIPDKELHNATIKMCNQGIYAINTALEEDNRGKLHRAVGDMSGILIGAHNALAQFKRKERLKSNENTRGLLALLFIGLMVLMNIVAAMK